MSSHQRHLMIALNAHPRMHRGAICRLGLDFDLWRRLRPGDARSAAELGVPVKQLDYALQTLSSADRVSSSEQRKADAHDVVILTRWDSDYPQTLLDHPLPPPVLYCRGTIPSGPTIGMVGARKCDGYGREVAGCFASQLARQGVIVVSGFAMGIDQAAHRGAVDGGGSTLAVLGCGIDVPYPSHSRELADDIARTGALLSEFPMGREPRAWNFPIRNRVIAAISAGVVVVQAKVRSGSLITAHAALELGRDVFAVPGRIFDELSLGVNGLLADGAVPANSVDDILSHLGMGHQRDLFPEASAPPVKTDPQPRPAGFPGKVLDMLPLGGSGSTAEDIATSLGVGVDRVLSALLELELSGRIERLPGPLYAR